MGVHVVVIRVSCFVTWALIGLCSAAPTSEPRMGAVPEAPKEQCFAEKCNRVTHYCDQVIRSCASCEDDCHPSRISQDEQAIKECQRICDWYYYVKSLNERNELLHDKKSKQPEDLETVAVHKYYVTVIVVLVVSFTAIVIFVLAMFACYIKRQSTRPLIVSQETKETLNGNIYKPYNLRTTPPSLIDPKNNSNETSLKLLNDYDNSSLEVRNGQQESLHQSRTNRSAICHSPSGHSLPRSGKLHSAQVNRNSSSLPPSQDSSIQPLVKSLQ